MTDPFGSSAGPPWWLARRLTQAQLTALTDDRRLARYRHRHGNPYMPLSIANELHRFEDKYAHLGAAVERRLQQQRDAKYAELRARLFPSARFEEADLKPLRHEND